MNTYINILRGLKQIKLKEENIYANEQKWKNEYIIIYHSNVKNKIDKKYDDEFKDL